MKLLNNLKKHENLMEIKNLTTKNTNINQVIIV